MKLRNLFATITKVDAEEGLVWGRLTQEIVDKSGETLDYELSKPLFQAWSDEAAKATDGRSLGNVREMHQLRAVGKLTDITYDDGERAVDICARIADQDVLDKCSEGIYTGFSVGGKLVRRWKEGDATKIIIAPSECSVVDNPCVPTAHFSYTKAAGAEPETRSFKLWEPTAGDIAKAAEGLAGASGTGAAWSDYIDEARAVLIKAHGDDAVGAEVEDTEEPAAGTESNVAAIEPVTAEADAEVVAEGETVEQAAGAEFTPVGDVTLAPEWEQVWRTRDGQNFAKKAEAVTHAGALRAGTTKLAAALAAAPADTVNMVPFPTVDGLAEVFAAHKALTAAFADNVAVKGMWAVSTLAGLIDQLGWITSDATWEAEREGDESKVPAALAESLRGLGAALIAMATEEVSELIASLQAQGVDVLTLEGVDGGIVELELAAGSTVIKAAPVYKAGARNSAADAERLQAAHDAIAACGAKCDRANLPDADKVDEIDVIKAERDALRNQGDAAAESIAKITGQVDAMKAEIETLKAQPGPAAPRMHVIGKEADGDGRGGQEGAADQFAAMLEKATPDQLAMLAIKVSQRTPRKMVEGANKV